MEAVETVETLVSALDSLGDLDVDGLTAGELDEHLVALLRQRHRLDAAVYKLAARWDAELVWVTDGSKSAGGRLARDARMSRASANRIIRRGRALREMPATERSLETGVLSGDHVDVLAGANARKRTERFAEHERLLAEQAAELRFDQFAKALAYWKRRADADAGDDGDEPDGEGRHARVGRGVGGEVHLDADLDPVGGAEFEAALSRIVNELAATDRCGGSRITRSRRQLRADALVEMARRAMAMPDAARKPRPLLTIVCGQDSFRELCELSNGVVIKPGQLLPHLDNLDIETLMFDGDLHAIGKSNRRSFTGAVRRAIEVRDRHCQHPSGCDEPLDRCDVDHIVPYCRGGETSQANGRLLCVFHNRVQAQHAAPPGQQPRRPPVEPLRNDPTEQAQPPPHED